MVDSINERVEDKVNRKPYVGVACVRDRQHIIPLISLAINLAPAKRVIGLGYQISDKTLAGIPNKYPLVCPPVDELSQLLSQSIVQSGPGDHFEHHLHWSTDDSPQVGDLRLIKISQLFGPYIQRLQINHPWPDPEVLHWWHQLHPNHQLIVSINNQSLAQEDNDPQRVADRFARYKGLPVAAFFDLSEGKGKPLDSKRAISFLEPLAFGQMNGHVAIAVAGGLGPDRLDVVQHIQDKLGGYISWDAQSKLYNQQGGLDVALAEQFIRQSIHI